VLTRADADSVDALATKALATYGSADHPTFLASARELAQDLPASPRRALARLTARSNAAGLIISGHSMDPSLGATPRHWRDGSQDPTARRYEFLLMLYGALVGDAFGWRTQQDGRIIHDILPIRGHEYEQLGSGSRAELTLHTEDAFHDHRCDLLLLFALQNPDAVPTVCFSVEWLREVDPTLFECRFLIKPDLSHLPANNSADATSSTSWSIDSAPTTISVLNGTQDTPFLRVDPYFMTAVDGDAEAAAALTHFDQQMRAAAREVVLHPGDLLVVDNHRVAHGRRPFRARSDGSDRWLKRALVTYDLRPSVHLHRGTRRL
jgi:Fe(II)/alpha-ketoglutarate-dependent arginine beta-hydroxylase